MGVAPPEPQNDWWHNWGTLAPPEQPRRGGPFATAGLPRRSRETSLAGSGLRPGLVPGHRRGAGGQSGKPTRERQTGCGGRGRRFLAPPPPGRLPGGSFALPCATRESPTAEQVGGRGRPWTHGGRQRETTLQRYSPRLLAAPQSQGARVAQEGPAGGREQGQGGHGHPPPRPLRPPPTARGQTHMLPLAALAAFAPGVSDFALQRERKARGSAQVLGVGMGDPPPTGGLLWALTLSPSSPGAPGGPAGPGSPMGPWVPSRPAGPGGPFSP